MYGTDSKEHFERRRACKRTEQETERLLRNLRFEKTPKLSSFTLNGSKFVKLSYEHTLSPIGLNNQACTVSP